MMLTKFIRILRQITTSPSVNILVGLVFLATGLAEAWREIEDTAIGAHHGAIVFGLFHILKCFPDFIEGFDYLQKSNCD